MGSYTAGRDTLNLSQMASTQMACIDKNYVPQKYVEALTKVTHYQVYNISLAMVAARMAARIREASISLPSR